MQPYYLKLYFRNARTTGQALTPRPGLTGNPHTPQAGPTPEGMVQNPSFTVDFNTACVLLANCKSNSSIEDDVNFHQ